MSAFPYASDDKIQQALTAIGAGAVASTTVPILQQILVAVATSSSGGGGGGATTWGSIAGTLSNQADLWTALNTKANLAGGNNFTGDQQILSGAIPHLRLAVLSDLGFGYGVIDSPTNGVVGVGRANNSVFFAVSGSSSSGYLNGSSFALRSVTKMGFTDSSTNPVGGTLDAFFMRSGAAASIQMGETSATPADQLFKGPNGSGTDIQGGDLRIGPGQSTGSATPGVLSLQSTTVGASGIALQTLVDVLTIPEPTNVILAIGSNLNLGNTAVSETPTATHTLLIKDSTGTLYKLLCVPA